MRPSLFVPMAILCCVSCLSPASAALTFTAPHDVVAVGTTTHDFEIRVTGSDAIQFYGVKVDVIRTSGTTPFKFATGLTTGKPAYLSDAEYLFVDRGANVTGASVNVLTRLSDSSLELKDGVSIPEATLGTPPPNSGIVPGVSGRMIAKLSLEFTGGIQDGDKFEINISALTNVGVKQFSTGPSGTASDFEFSSGAANGVTFDSSSYSGNQISSTFISGSVVSESVTAVPEPSSLTLVGLIACGSLSLVRRRKAMLPR